MELSTLFRQLSYGELSNLAISASGSGTIITSKQPQLVHYINDALTAIYTRFVLSEEEVIIEQIEGRTLYPLLAKHSQTTGDADEDDLFIVDNVEEPFLDNLVIRIKEVWGTLETWNSEKHIHFPLNDSEARFSLFTPSPLVLQVPEPIGGEPLSVIYQGYHPRISEDLVGDPAAIDLDQVINLPYYLNNALQQLVASKVYSHMNGQENLLKGQEYLMAYESACSEIEQKDLANQTWHTSHIKLEQRGFV
jgi:hypothetical protein